MKDRSTINLIESARNGNRDAFGRLYCLFHRHIFFVIIKIVKNWHTAEETTNDVFIQAFLKIRGLRSPNCFAGWLRKIAFTVAVCQSRKSRKHRLFDPTKPFPFDCVDNITPFVDSKKKDERSKVREAIHELSDLDQATLTAFYLNFQLLREMKESFKVPLGTIKSRLHRARRRLAKKLQS